jgi:DNA modification methylase
MKKKLPEQWPATSIERRSLASLKPFSGNARTHSEEQVAQIAASIRQYGWTNPMLVDEAGGIIAGHGRRLAAMSMGVDDVPVIVARGWSEAQRRAYVLADNQLALNADWDKSLLKVELGDLGALGFDLSFTGFSPSAITALLNYGVAHQADPDDVPATPTVAVSRMGDLWTLGKHRLLCGDATSAADVARLLGDAKPHLMVTDPPYGVEYDPSWRNSSSLGNRPGSGAMGKVMNDDRADWREAWALFPGDVAYVWHGGLHAATVADSLAAAGFVMRNQIIWDKTRLIIGRGDYHWEHEPCWYAVRKGKRGHWSKDRKQTTMWRIPHQRSETGHGTQKPVECMKRPIENNSEAGDAVYEPFSGSGTTIIAAEMTARSCLALELSPTYVDVAVLRWQTFTGQVARLETGETFAEIKEKRAEA